jgi:hypothetical protein
MENAAAILMVLTVIIVEKKGSCWWVGYELSQILMALSN